MPVIDPNVYMQANQQAKRSTPGTEMGQDQFMKLLVTQLQNQDPLNPMEDKDFMAQMAQFSSLEQMMKMTKSIDTLVQSQLVSPVIQYSHMIGKHVSYQVKDEETGAVTDTKSGKVVSVSQKDGWAILELDNGEKVYADAVNSVSDKAISSTQSSDKEPVGKPEDGKDEPAE